MSIDSLLAQARRDLDRIEDERNRLVAQGIALGFIAAAGGGLIALDPTGAGNDALVTLGLIEQLDRFAGEVFPRIEAKALEGNEDAARRLARASANILSAVTGLSPLDDFAENAQTLVRETVADLKDTSIGLGVLAFFFGLIYVLK